MSQITSHVLDTSSGKPAANLPVKLCQWHDGQWRELAQSNTNDDGRCGALLADDFELQPGRYRMFFDTASYFQQQQQQGFYPYVEVVFELQQTDEHYHIPLLLSPYGYSTYRGS